MLPIGRGRTKPLSSYFLTVGNTGERKSESDRQAKWPIEKREKALREQKLSLDESRVLLKFYESGLEGYTYLE